MKFSPHLMTLMLLIASLFPAGLRASESQLDPEAVARLQASLKYLAGLQQFSLETLSSIEAVLHSGQKLQFDTVIAATLKRPNKLYVKRKGELVNQVFYYNGSTLTLQNPVDGFFATVDAPDNLDDMMDFARDELDIIAPAGDFMYSDAFEFMMQDVESGFIVGPAEVSGVVCDHLAFSAPGTDWQVWVERGDTPLPRKLVITSRDILNAPQFTLFLNNWNLKPVITESTFEFSPPENAIEIEFMKVHGSE